MRPILILAASAALTIPALATSAILQSSAQGSLNGALFVDLSGDPVAAKAALDASSATLAADPNNPDLLAEHGLFTVTVAAQTMQTDPAAGQVQFTAGLAYLDRAVELAPENPQTRVLRGIVMQQSTYSVPEFMAGPMLTKGLADFQFVYDTQNEVLGELGEHRLGELLQIKADLESRSGKVDQAGETYSMIRTMLPGTEYAARADAWALTREPLPQNMTTCVGCHVSP